VVTSQNATTSYIYGPGHLLQQIVDPRGAKTTVSYDQSCYRQVVMADQPLAYWRLGETSGATAVDVTGAYPGTITGGVTLGQGGGLWNDPDLSYKFDGTTGYVTVSPNIAGITTLLTLEAWVNHSGVAWANDHEFVISARATSVYLSVYRGSIFMSVYDGTSQRLLTGGAVPSAGWHHLVGTWDGAQIRLYIDGLLTATSPTYTEASMTTVGALRSLTTTVRRFSSRATSTRSPSTQALWPHLAFRPTSSPVV
jgi:hypothetical protein